MFRIRYQKVMLYLVILLVVSIFMLNAIIWFESIRKQSIQSESSITRLDSENLFDKHNATLNTKIYFFRDSQNKKSKPKYHYQLNWSTRFKYKRPWFMKNGTVRPSKKYSTKLAIWPEEINDANDIAQNDRIVNQLMYIPENYNENHFVPKGKLPLKKIMLYFGKNGWGDLPLGREKFIHDNCPVNACFITANPDHMSQADSVIFKDRFVWPKNGRQQYNQLWILFLLECPYNTQIFNNLGPNVFNWTATYRHDSDIVTPYEKFVSEKSLNVSKHFDFVAEEMLRKQTTKNYAMGKTKKVAWFVSNCGARNKRLEYARELSKYIQVDIYGTCGNHKCARKKSKECFEMLNHDYKFYLAFENSNCLDYITEKFFVNGLGHNWKDYNIVPIVMGGHPEDYRRSSPENSFIHVNNFKTPFHLAQYLNELDSDDEAYNQYFKWKSNSRNGEFINTYFWCRICAMLHAPPKHQKPSVSYYDIEKWWSPKNICIDGTKKWTHADSKHSF